MDIFVLASMNITNKRDRASVVPGIGPLTETA